MKRIRQPASGPLKGVTVVEMGGIGPAPFCGQLLADFGADVIVVERSRQQSQPSRPANLLMRGKRSICLDLKKPDQVAILKRLIAKVDVIIDPYRPGVMERLGIGPDDCLSLNPALIFARMTGWGQAGPYAQSAGHDINYIAITGALHAMGEAGRLPMPPLNLVGDFGAGGMSLAFGIVSGVLEARASGKGQVVDAAICDAASYLMGQIYAFHNMNLWSEDREANLLDGGAPYYRCYETADSKFISFGPIEDKFFQEFVDRLDLDVSDIRDRRNPDNWKILESRIAASVAQKTRADWEAQLAGTDVCFAPVLTYIEALSHPHNIARGNFIEVDGAIEPAPAPRFGRTPGKVRSGAPFPGEDTEEVLAELLGEQVEVS